MKNLFLTLSLLFLTSFVFAVSDTVVPPSPYETIAATPTYVVLTVSSSSVVSVPAVSRGVYRIITNNSLYTIYNADDSRMSYSTIITSGTPIYSHEHFIDDRWYGAMYFTADPTALSSTCDVRVDTKQRQ